MKKIIYYLPRVIAAFIMLQTLFFKFGFGGVEALQESRNLFSTVANFFLGSAENEGLMRIGTGIAELIASVLLFVPKVSKFGGLMTMGVMGGAILTHFLALGIDVAGDGGTLFIMACVAFLSGAKAFYDDRKREMAG